jgi:hypothetical protein
MLNDKLYRLYIQRHLKLLFFVMAALFTLIALLMITGLLQSAKGDGPPRMLGLFFLGMVGLYSYWILSLPHTIVVSESGQVGFISAIRNRQTTLCEIRSIKPDSQFGFLIVKTSGRKIRIINQFDEFHDFILRLKTANPSVELRGC